VFEVFLWGMIMKFLDQLSDRITAAKNPETQWFILNRLAQIDGLTLDQAEHVIDWIDSERPDRSLSGMAAKDALRLAEAWTKALVARGDNIIETEEDLEILFTTSSGSRLVKLLTKNALMREGRQMNHCVGSMEPGDIYSIRNKANKAIATLTWTKDDDGRIEQLQGKGNGPIHPKYIKDTLEVLQFIGVELNSRWMEKLGYVQLASEVWHEIDTNWTKVKETTVGGTRYFWLPCGPNLKKKQG
jgi:hypothetical protein